MQGFFFELEFWLFILWVLCLNDRSGGVVGHRLILCLKHSLRIPSLSCTCIQKHCKLYTLRKYLKMSRRLQLSKTIIDDKHIFHATTNLSTS